MYCKNCGKNNPEKSIFCKFCGIKLEDLGSEKDNYAHDSDSSVIDQNTPPYPYVISTAKLIVLSIATLSLYEIYWFYKHWKSFNNHLDLKHGTFTLWIYSVFSPISAFSLFKKVGHSLNEIDKARKLETGGLALVFLVLSFASKMPEPYWILSMISFLPIIPIQNAINDYWVKKYGDKVIKSGFGLWNILWTILGGIILILALYGTFGSNSTSSSENQVNSSTDSISPTPFIVKNFNQEEIVPSVVNIFCPSTYSGESGTGGSGTIVSDGGVVLTNAHIIPHDKTNIHVDDTGCIVVIPDSTTGQPKDFYLGTPILIPGLSEEYDLAYISIYSAYYDKESQEYQGVYPQKFPAYNETTRCSNENVKLGEKIRIFGYPAISGGYSLTITDGLISSFPGDGLIVTSAKISHGNSGGLAVDEQGCMIGVPSLVSSDESESLGVIYSMDIVNQFSNEVMTYLNKNK